MEDEIQGLIDVLLDKTARDDERDDAAMDLGAFNDDRALNALLLIATDSNEDRMILDSCGESIADLWVLRNHFDPNLYKKMARPAKREIYRTIENVKPEWIQEFNLNPP